jgi:hypothetical protein
LAILKRGEKIHQMQYMQWQQDLIVHAAQVLQFSKPALESEAATMKRKKSAKMETAPKKEPGMFDKLVEARGKEGHAKQVCVAVCAV